MDAIYSWSAGRRYALSAGGVLLATLMLTRLSADFQVANIALIYLLVVLLVATTIGRGPAILASALAFLGFNFFFVEPLHSFRVTDPQDNLRLLTFLVVAIIGSNLAAARVSRPTPQRAAHVSWPRCMASVKRSAPRLIWSGSCRWWRRRSHSC